MKIGVRGHDFGRYSIQDFPKVIKESGFECVQLAPVKAISGISSFADITEKAIYEIGESFTKENIEITVLGCYIEPSISDISQRLSNIDIFKQNLIYAKQIDVPYVATETTHLYPNATENQRETAYKNLLDSTLRIVEQAENLGVNVAIEPVAEHTLNTPELAYRLITDVNSDKLKIIFDPVNMILPNTWYEQEDIFTRYFNLLGDYICVIHAKDTTFSKDTISPQESYKGEEGKVWANIGTGVVNYGMIMTYLKEKHPNIRILREVAKMDSYKQDLEKLKELIK